jgi:GTPase
LLYRRGETKSPPLIIKMGNPEFRSGFVVILGKPNTGKSTLLNHILGEKLSIVSPKPQTTRYAIKGILNRDDCQVVFIDTPGYLKPRYEMQERMLRIWSEALQDVDLVVFISDVLSFPTEYDTEVLQRLERLKTPQLAVFNKIDLRHDVNREEYCKQLPSSINATHFISARTGEGTGELMEAMLHYLPFHEPYYSEDQLSDLPTRFFAQEAIREAVFHIFEQEIPYATAVLIERWTEDEDQIIIDAVIWLEKQSQKIILIGKKGENLAKIRIYAEKQLMAFLGTRVQIHLWIKVNPNWRRKAGSLKELGFG